MQHLSSVSSVSLILFNLLLRALMAAACVQLLFAATVWTLPHMGGSKTSTTTTSAAASGPFGSTERLNGTGAAAAAAEAQPDVRTLSRRRRAVSSREIRALLDFHNQVRSQVVPPAANMELMVRRRGCKKHKTRL